MSDTVPTVRNIKRHNGIMGQVSVTCDVSYLGGEPERHEFVGFTYGVTVVTLFPSVWQPEPVQIRVVNPTLHGMFGEDPEGWVRRYFAERGNGANFA